MNHNAFRQLWFHHGPDVFIGNIFFQFQFHIERVGGDAYAESRVQGNFHMRIEPFREGDGDAGANDDTFHGAKVVQVSQEAQFLIFADRQKQPFHVQFPPCGQSSLRR